MLYTRSSFIKWLTEIKECEIVNLNDYRPKVLSLKNGPASAYIMTSRKDQIDYEEIYMVCKKLWLDLPGNNDLELIE